MKVKAIASSFSDAPEEVLQAGWSRECKIAVTTGREYEVHALSLFGEPEHGRPRILVFQILEDGIEWPFWLPSFLFEVIDQSIPADWQCNLLPSGTFVAGPAFVAESPEAYRAMVEQEPDAMRQFRARQREVESRDG